MKKGGKKEEKDQGKKQGIERKKWGEYKGASKVMEALHARKLMKKRLNKTEKGDQEETKLKKQLQQKKRKKNEGRKTTKEKEKVSGV